MGCLVTCVVSLVVCVWLCWLVFAVCFDWCFGFVSLLLIAVPCVFLVVLLFCASGLRGWWVLICYCLIASCWTYFDGRFRVCMFCGLRLLWFGLLCFVVD